MVATISVSKGTAASAEVDAFRRRMESQCMQIRAYRQAECRGGRKLSLDEAALEWIERYAASFDRAYGLD